IPADGLSEAIVSFSRFLREQGFNVGIRETQEAVQVAADGLVQHKFYFKSALKSLFCRTPEERLRFEKLFLLFWRKDPVELNQKRSEKNQQHKANQAPSTAPTLLGDSPNNQEELEAVKSTTGASASEQFRKTDFSKVADMDAQLFEELSEQLFREMALRLRRRQKLDVKQGVIHLRKTIRRSIGFGGEPIQLLRKTRRPGRRRLILLLDVSGSMDRYSFYLLRFICALRENFRQLEAFVFSTSLVRITAALQESYLEFALAQIAAQADHWSSGTKIGACLQDFVDGYGKELLNGSPLVVVLSDGLETGDPALLHTALQRIKGRAWKVVWLNPLKGNPNYQPLAKGMSVALPHLDKFGSAHNLESLMKLEELLNKG
ncbi:MAG: VWA domain-containing protein, partial [Saprospiraceae bacterium]|nr:VWA domain-containing protein [Saprospiraceae bacterium]